ncbi:MAG: hypothetical protein N3B11_05640 [Coriobacteriia bacterium]|nr:hypothetical protein [Coriobacteriia bacterium]
MPRYDYKCVSCATVFEVVRSAADGDGAQCPECGGSAKRVFSPVGIVFKGSGFHNTDYKPRSGSDGDGSSRQPKSEKPACAGSSCSTCPAADS